MLSQNIKQLEIEVRNIQAIKQRIMYTQISNRQPVDTLRIDMALANLLEAIRSIKASKLFNDEYQEAYGNPTEEDHNPYVKSFKHGSANPFITTFGGKKHGNSNTGGSGAIPTSNAKNSTTRKDEDDF